MSARESDLHHRPNKVEEAVRRLTLLRNGQAALLTAISAGPIAIPVLASLLLSRSSDGIFEPRCLAAQALGRLGAQGVLLDYLAVVRKAQDPHEQAAEDAVLNAVARASIPFR